MKISIQKSKGYSGKMAAYGKAYVARITGLSGEYGFERAFEQGKADSTDPFRKSKCTWNEVYDLGAGLFEIFEGGEKTYKIIWIKDGAGAHKTIDTSRAREMARLMDDGHTYEEARLATKPVTA